MKEILAMAPGGYDASGIMLSLLSHKLNKV